MSILEHLEKGTFNELINYSFAEVREVFNLNRFFVTDAQGNQFVNEAVQIKQWYSDELNKVEKYAAGEYADSLNAGIDVPEFEQPAYKVNNVELQAKRKLIRLIATYFNKDLFDYHKKEIYGTTSFKETIIETPHEMLVSLNANKSRIYSLLTILGYYQRRYGYFLSQADFLKICYDYSSQVYFVNKSRGMRYRFVNIFYSGSRIKPPKTKKSSSDPTIQYYKDEHYQSNKFIDVDKISLVMLVQPYLKNNTREINKIIEIMDKHFSKKKDRSAWPKTLNEVAEFIQDCESKGIMKRL